MLEIPDSLVERLKARQAVLVAGLGCTELANAPGWSGLTAAMASHLVFSDARQAVARLTSAARLMDAVAFIRDLVPHPVIEEAVKTAYPAGLPVPDSIQQFAEFPWRAVVTTAFDDLWERALAAARGGRLPPTVSVATDDPVKAQKAGSASVPLLHLYGRVGLPESLVIGPGDARLRLTGSPGLAWLDHIVQRRSLVFVGFRPGDPDLVWLTSWLALRQREGVPHFLFLDVAAEADPDTEASVWALRTGLEIVICPDGTAEAVERLAKISASIAAQLPPSEADIDFGIWLDRWAQDRGNQEARDMLGRIEAALREDERWDRLVELLLRRLELEESEPEQLATLREVARIFRDLLGAPERALPAEIAMLRLVPGDDELWEKLRADAGAGGGWDQLVAGATDIATAAGQTPEAARIWREVARALNEELGRPEDALAAYREALIADPGDRATRDAEAALLRQLGRWSELVAALRAASGEADDPERAAALMLEVAELHEGELGDVAGAVTAYEAVLAMAPDSTVAAAALERLYERDKRWGDLASLLAQRAQTAPPAEAAALRRRRAGILADDLDSLDLAAEELESLAAETPDVADRQLLTLLEQIYQRAERHDDYLATLQRQADAMANPVDRLAILRRLATEGETRPDGLDRASEALEQILRLEPRDSDAFFALERIYRGADRPGALATALQRRLEVTETIDARREIMFALGEVYEHELDEWEKALDSYSAAEKAGDRRQDVYAAVCRLGERLGRWDVATEAATKWTEMAPENPGALAALGRISRQAGDFDRAVSMFLDAAIHEPTPAGQAALFTEAATIVDTTLGKEDQAVELYVRALGADPDHASAAERLAQIYATRGRWSDVEELLDIVAGGLDASDTDRFVAVQMRLAEACVELGKTKPEKMDKALDCLARAHEARAESLPVLHKFGDLRMQRHEWKDALALYESILRSQRQALSPTDAAEVAMQIGVCQTELGNADAAFAAYKEAKALSPKYRPALEALAAAYAVKEDWKAWVAERHDLAAIAGAEERPAMEEELGDAYADKLADPARAEASYRKSLELEPNRRGPLYKLLEIYTKDKRWQPAIELLNQLAKIEEDPARRARTLYTTALILRDELHNPKEASVLLEQVLDEDPDMAVAFQDLEALHRAASDWKALALSYRRMVKRLPESATALRLSLWTRLGELATRQLRDRNLAVQAFEAAAALDPADVPRQETLAHLYELGGADSRDQAIAAHQKLLARDPHRTDSYRALAKLYGDVGDLDKQWCVASALYYLKKIDPGMEAVFRRHRPPQVRLPQRAFTEETWQRVVHPDEDRLLDGLFALSAPYLAAPAAKPPETLGLGRRHRVDLQADRSPPVLAVIQLADMMGLPMPELFRGDNENAQTMVVNLQYKGRPKLALVLAPSTQRRNSFDLVFDLSCQMAFLRPERLLRFAFGTPAALDLGLRAALALGAASGAAAPNWNGEAGQLIAYLRRAVPPQVVAALAAAGRTLAETRGDKVDVARWMAATHLSAARAALVLTGDLGAAARVISSEPMPTTPIPIQKRLVDLVAFSVSEDYFACRRQLGLQIVRS